MAPFRWYADRSGPERYFYFDLFCIQIQQIVLVNGQATDSCCDSLAFENNLLRDDRERGNLIGRQIDQV